MYQMENHMYLMNAFTYMEAMIAFMEQNIVWMIMYAGRLVYMIWQNGNMKGWFCFSAYVVNASAYMFDHIIESFI